MSVQTPLVSQVNGYNKFRIVYQYGCRSGRFLVCTSACVTCILHYMPAYDLLILCLDCICVFEFRVTKFTMNESGLFRCVLILSQVLFF